MSREYCQYGFRSGVDSVIGSRDGGFWYADAVEMNTYCPVRPVNRSMSACTCSRVEGHEVDNRVKVKTVNRSSNGPGIPRVRPQLADPGRQRPVGRLPPVKNEHLDFAARPPPARTPTR